MIFHDKEIYQKRCYKYEMAEFLIGKESMGTKFFMHVNGIN